MVSDCCVFFPRQSDALLYESLRKLQLTPLSVEMLKVRLECLLFYTIVYVVGFFQLQVCFSLVDDNTYLVLFQATEIGKSVNALRKHGSKEIRNLVRTLIE